MINPAISNYISRIKQALATVDEASAQFGGLYWQASRICEFVDDPQKGWTPKINPDGTFAMLVTDEDLHEMNFPHMTSQQLGTVLFGTIEIMSNIPTELADLIGNLRE